MPPAHPRYQGPAAIGIFLLDVSAWHGGVPLPVVRRGERRAPCTGAVYTGWGKRAGVPRVRDRRATLEGDEISRYHEVCREGRRAGPGCELAGGEAWSRRGNECSFGYGVPVIAARGGRPPLGASARGTGPTSSAGERFPDMEEVTGSNRVRPTIFQRMLAVGAKTGASGEPGTEGMISPTADMSFSDAMGGVVASAVGCKRFLQCHVSPVGLTVFTPCSRRSKTACATCSVACTGLSPSDGIAFHHRVKALPDTCPNKDRFRCPDAVTGVTGNVSVTDS